MKILYLRFISKTPQFFKRLQKLGGSLVVLCAGVSAVPGISERLASLTIDGAVAGAVMVLVSQFAVENTSDLI